MRRAPEALAGRAAAAPRRAARPVATRPAPPPAERAAVPRAPSRRTRASRDAGDPDEAAGRRHGGLGVQVALPVRQHGVPARPHRADAAVRRHGAADAVLRPHDVERASTTRATSRAARRARSVALSQKSWDAITTRVRRDRPAQGRRHQDRRRPGHGPDHRAVDDRPGEPPRHHLLRDVRLAISWRPRPAALRVGPVGIMQIQPGAPASRRPQDRLRQRLPHGQRRRLDARRGDGFAVAARATISRTTPPRIYAPANTASRTAGSTPTGRFSMSATNYRTWLGAPSKLYDTKTGANIAAPGWDGDGHERRDARVLARRQAASPSTTRTRRRPHPRRRWTSPSRPRRSRTSSTWRATRAHYLGWPAFTPDGKSVVYHAGIRTRAFETDSGATGDLYVVDIATKTRARLDALDGYSAAARRTCPRTTRI